MRIKPSASFPHPILSPDTVDYGDRTFQIAMTVTESPELGQAVLNGTMTLNDPSIIELLDSQHAVSGVMVTCLDTYMDIFEHNPLGDIRIDLSGGLVRGPVFIRGVVIAKETLTLDSEWIDTEFPIQAKEIQPGDLIAFTEELRFEAGLEKLAPLESIFHLKRHENVAEGVFEIYLEGESIEILVAPDLHGFLSLLRGQIMKDTLLSSLFLPVVMATLEAMRAEDAYSEKRWHSIMSARCSAESIDFKNSDIAEAAQKLLDSPLGALHKMFAREST